MQAKMAVDLRRKPQDKAAPQLPGGGAAQFFGDVKQEFRKITWTESEELKAYTKVVAIATLAFGMSIYIVDLIVRAVIGALGTIAQWLG